MAGATILSPPPFPTTTTTTTTTDHPHNSSAHKLCAKLSYPSLHHPFRRNPRISICCRRGKVCLFFSSSSAFCPRHAHKSRLILCCSQLNNSTREEAQEIADDGFFFDGGGDLVVEEDDETDEEDEETEESSVDLLVRFLQSMVKKISKRAKKASRSVLPPAISTQLVSFAVDGLMLLASLSIVKALLEVHKRGSSFHEPSSHGKPCVIWVVCTLGGTVFVAILLLRVIWATVSYFQTSGNNFNQGGSSFGTAQPVTYFY
ncbi:hypothetical protein TIFTF001_010950 [Ficus carica]|uniref:Uncharacterized protein n=1 Tax=Ficus carica TaxID=3494 RepID=A0AA88AD50_FICCA|nr:hypothetical protein TIFTF001_010950 [Ficus carica]